MLVLTMMFMDSVFQYKPIEMPFGTMMAASFVFSLNEIAKMILWSCTLTLVYSTILGAPGTLLVAWLKDQEGLKVRRQAKAKYTMFIRHAKIVAR